MTKVDYIYQNQAFGSVADRLLAANMDPLCLRPWLDRKGRSCLDAFGGYDEKGNPKVKTLFTNTPATLPKDAWLKMDESILRVQRAKLRVWGDIVGAGLTYSVPNGMGTTLLQHQTMTDAGEAAMSMDGLRETNRDRVNFDIGSIPLPIIHSDFSFSLREILVSRNGTPIDTTMAEQAMRKCVEMVERLTIGTTGSYSYGGGTIYGLTNFTSRLTGTMTLPTASGWTPSIFVDEILGFIQTLTDLYYNGPFGIWMSPGWTRYLDGDYSAAYGGETLRTRLAKIGDISFWRKADYLSNFKVIIVQLSPTVLQAVTGMPFVTLQWDEKNGLAKHFKVMGIMVPRLRADSNGNTGILEATAA